MGPAGRCRGTQGRGRCEPRSRAFGSVASDSGGLGVIKPGRVLEGGANSVGDDLDGVVVDGVPSERGRSGHGSEGEGKVATFELQLGIASTRAAGIPDWS
ncbi:hypothetical protein [Oryza sativa Japonica Group]|uniref:Uncharacterized protein n=1 Tax=Oryza sativa subsp. japonica TaxID=39947 RepID=Q5VNL1_ORYSJ|nr:hypothetical protein [Oryza sativa Japonica Group]